MFPIVKYKKDHEFPLKIYYGLADLTRPYEYVRCTFEKKDCLDDIKLIEKMDHEYRHP